MSDGTLQLNKDTPSNEFLESLGKEASDLYTSKKVPLNEAVVKVSSPHNQLNTEHVLRVTEHANTETYLHYHNLNKTSGASSSYPKFELADPRLVLEMLNAPDNTETHSVKDYLTGPASTRSRISSNELSAGLETMFKVSTTHTDSKDSIAHEIFTLQDKTSAARATFIEAVGSCDSMYKEAAASFEEEVKGHLLTGGSLEDVISSLGSASFTDSDISEHLTPILESLQSRDIVKTSSVNGSKISFDRIVNEEHPLITSFSAMVRADEEMKVASVAASSLGESLAELKSFIRKELL